MLCKQDSILVRRRRVGSSAACEALLLGSPEVRYRVRLDVVGRRRRLVASRLVLLMRPGSHEHGPPPVARRSRSNRRPHPSSSSATALPVAQAAADRQVVLADRVPEVVVHRTDAALHPCCPLASHSGLSTLTGFAWSTANKQTWATYNSCVSTNPAQPISRRFP